MKILIGVTGSIACYRTYDLTRELSKLGHEVKIILSKGAQKFIRPELFRYLGAKEVYLSQADFNLNHYENRSSGQVLHIELARWCDRLLVVPASANYLKTLSSGATPDLLSSVFLSLGKKPVIIYPAMNSEMLNHPFTQENIDKLNKLNNIFIAPTAHGLLACGEVGEGKLLSNDIILKTFDVFHQKPEAKKKVLITTGATIAPLDPVRFLTNGSSGKTGFHLAKKFLSENYQVTVIAGKEAVIDLDYLSMFSNFNLIRVITASEMKAAVLTHFKTTDLYISSAAVNDIEFDVASDKIKKSSLTSSLAIKSSPDILAEVLALRKPSQKIIGFAAETKTTSETFQEKYSRKKVDLLIGNEVKTDYNHQAKKGFGTEDGNYFFIENGVINKELHLSKSELATRIYEWAQ